MEKQCGGCKRIKPLSNFDQNPNNKDGLNKTCGMCMGKALRWQRKNPEKCKEIDIRKYKKNAKKRKEASQRRYKDNPEKYKEMNIRWRKANPEKVYNIQQSWITRQTQKGRMEMLNAAITLLKDQLPPEALDKLKSLKIS